jgi:hypothetical protein
MHACNCMGPQNGEPYCPCMMRDMVQHEGRWIRPERDIGPVSPLTLTPSARGCICPVGAEKTCQGSLCPRKAIDATVRS